MRTTAASAAVSFVLAIIVSCPYALRPGNRQAVSGRVGANSVRQQAVGHRPKPHGLHSGSYAAAGQHQRQLWPGALREKAQIGSGGLPEIPSRCLQLPGAMRPVGLPDTMQPPARRVLRQRPSKYKSKASTVAFGAPSDAAATAQAVQRLKALTGRDGSGAARPVTGWQQIFQPHLPRHSLGSCAVVGLSSRLLGSCLGQAIDSHDTVMRFGGAPVKGWEADVGRKKSVQLIRLPFSSKCTDIDNDVWFKGGRMKASNTTAADKRPPEDFYLITGETAGKCHHKFASKFKGVPVRALKYEPLVIKASSDLYSTFQHATGRSTSSKGRDLKGTGGFNLIIALIMSQVCRRISLYGFGQGEGGHYFLQKRFEEVSERQAALTMKDVHSTELEHWLLRRAMSAALLCYYDKGVLSTGATCDFAASGA